MARDTIVDKSLMNQSLINSTYSFHSPEARLFIEAFILYFIDIELLLKLRLNSVLNWILQLLLAFLWMIYGRDGLLFGIKV